MTERSPPHSVEAERSIIGALLLDNRAMDEIVSTVAPEHFYRGAHKAIFTAMIDIYQSGEQIDVVTVCDLLNSRNQLEKIGGSEYLASLETEVPAITNIAHYAKIVREKAMLRSLAGVCGRIQADCYAEPENVQELIDRAERDVCDVAQARVQQNFVDLHALLTETFKTQTEAKHGNYQGLSIGFRDLDDTLGGLRKGNYIIIAARPSIGKTAFALNIARNVAGQGKRVGFFSMEMSESEIGLRLIATETALLNAKPVIDLAYIQKPKYMSAEAWQEFTDSVLTLQDLPLHVDDSGGLSTLELRSKARLLKAEKGSLDLLIVDYVQLMHHSGRSENRQQEITEISRRLKELAKELDIPVIALSQLSRNPEQRENKRPMLSDLRESGSLEQDADVVLFIFRPEIYDRNDLELEGKAEIIVAKQRNGPIGSTDLYFDRKHTLFRDLSRREDRSLEAKGPMSYADATAPKDNW